MKLRIITGILALISLASCGTRKESGADNSQPRQYIPEKTAVTVMELKKEPFKYHIVSNGKLQATSLVDLSFRTAGIVEKVMVRDGDRVHRGDVLGTLESSEKRLMLESSRITKTKAEYELYDILTGLGYEARDTNTVPKELLETAKMRSGYQEACLSVIQAEYELRGCEIRAPFSGKAANVKLNPHDRTGAVPLCTILDDSSLKVDFPVLESEYPQLSTGLDVTVVPYADRNVTIKGKIKSINPTVDSKGQIRVTAVIPNNGKLLDGMNVRVTVEKNMTEQIAVPKNAVVIRDDEEVIFLYDDGKARWTYVDVIMSNSESHCIVPDKEKNASLNTGDKVIISGNLNLADGSLVTLK